MSGFIENWPAASAPQPGDQLLIVRPTATPPEMLLPASSIATPLAEVTLAANQLLGANGAGAPAAISAGTGISIGGNQISATGADHAGYPVLQALDPAAKLVVQSANAPALLPLAFINTFSARYPVPLEAFGSPNGSDWTGPINNALASNQPFSLQPATYLAEGDLINASTSYVGIFGIPGVSTIKRPTANSTSAGYITLSTSEIYIDGVIFDMGGPSAASPNWGAYFGFVGTLRVSRAAFQNHQGGLGTGCLISANPSEPDRISCIFDDVMAINNLAHGIWVEHAAAALFRSLRCSSNGGQGFQAQRFSTRTGSEMKRLMVQTSQFFANGGAGLAIGNYAETGLSGGLIYGPDSPDVTEVVVETSQAWGNGTYGFVAQAERTRFSQLECDAGGTAGDYLVNARQTDLNDCTSANANGIAVDTGGSENVAVRRLRIIGAGGYGLNVGGCLDVMVDGADIQANQYAITMFNPEQSGQGVPFPFRTQRARFRDIRVDMSNLNTLLCAAAVILADGPQDVAFDTIDFISNASTQNPTVLGAQYAISARTDTIKIERAKFNAAPLLPLTPSAGVLTVPDLCDLVALPAGATVSTVQTQTMATIGSGIGWINVTSPGSGLIGPVNQNGQAVSGATTATLTGDGNIAGVGTLLVQVWNGQLVGVHVPNASSGFTHASVTFSGPGTGMAATVQVGVPIPKNKRITLLFPGGGTLFGNAVAAGGVMQLIEYNGGWLTK